jgi:TRAP-type transport system periplasmic protein
MKLSRLMTVAGISVAISFNAFAETKLKLAHAYDPADPVHKAAEVFAEVAKRESNGELNIRLFPSGQLGKVKQVQEGVQLGFVHIVIESIGTLSSFNPIAGVESMPYLFDDAEHYRKIWNGPVGQEIKNELESESNWKILGHMYRGSRELTSNKKVTSIGELDGLKIRVTPIKERLVTWETFGASPTPMAFSELFTALQQGVIDAQENPIATIHKNSFYEVQDYLIKTSHMANGFTFQMNFKKFNDHPVEIQNALQTAAKEAADSYNAYVVKHEAELLADLEAKGMEIVEVDKAPFREKAKEVVAQFPELEEWYLKMTNVN